MLTESTGEHFLDSGGDDGRHWQQNQKKTLSDFESEPYEIIEMKIQIILIGNYLYFII